MVGALIVEKGEVVAKGFIKNRVDRMPNWKPLILWAVNHPQMHPLSFPWSPARPIARPPCTDAILHSGIQTVYVAGLESQSPARWKWNRNPSGERFECRACQPGDIQERTGRLNFIFNHNMQTGRPMIVLKLAESPMANSRMKRSRPSE